jgi:hypothetical protein
MSDAKKLEDEFSWENVTVVPRQDPVAVYWSADGDLVIRQEWDRHEDDVMVVVAHQNVRALLNAIRTLLKDRDS